MGTFTSKNVQLCKLKGTLHIKMCENLGICPACSTDLGPYPSNNQTGQYEQCTKTIIESISTLRNIIRLRKLQNQHIFLHDALLFQNYFEDNKQ